jgi:hypothetical protein
MSVPGHPAPTLIKKITAFFAAQDGSETKKQLIPSLRAHLSTGRASAPTEDALSEVIRKLQDRVKRWNSKQHATEKTIAEYQALQERLASTRLTAARKATIEAESAPIIRAYKKRKQQKRTAQIVMEEKLVKVLAGLREKNKTWTEEREKVEAEQKEEKKAQKSEERKLREERAAAEKAERKAAEEKKKDEELELKTRIRDQRALQSLEAKAKVMDLETAQRRAAERAERIEGKLEKLLDLELQARANKHGGRRAMRDDAEESEEDKENIEPVSDWRL